MMTCPITREIYNLHFMNPRKRGIILSFVVLALSLGNYARLSGTESIRPIHIITLLTMGAAIGVMLVHLITYFRGRKS